jgi:hypothetical protein
MLGINNHDSAAAKAAWTTMRSRQTLARTALLATFLGLFAHQPLIAQMVVPESGFHMVLLGNLKEDDVERENVYFSGVPDRSYAQGNALAGDPGSSMSDSFYDHAVEAFNLTCPPAEDTMGAAKGSGCAYVEIADAEGTAMAFTHAESKVHYASQIVLADCADGVAVATGQGQVGLGIEILGCGGSFNLTYESNEDANSSTQVNDEDMGPWQRTNSASVVMKTWVRGSIALTDGGGFIQAYANAGSLVAFRP